MLIFLASGCGKEGDIYSTTNNTSESTSEAQSAEGSSRITGVFFDSLVEGLVYQGRTSKLSGITNASGEFTCEKDEEVDFFIGRLNLGNAKCAQIITPKSLYSIPTDAINLGILLIALDEDNNLDNGIKIPQNLQDQSYEEGMLGYDINVADLVADTANRIISGAPANTFYNGGVIPSIETVRRHFDAGVEGLGSYSGEISEYQIEEASGNCRLTKFLSAKVGADKVSLTGFAGFSSLEVSLRFDRILNSAAGISSFDGEFDLPYKSDGSNLYDQVRITNSIIDGKIEADFSAGKINNDGSFNPLCSGTLTLEKDIPLSNFIQLRKAARRISNRSGSMLSIIDAGDYGSDIFAQSQIANTAAIDFYNCTIGSDSTKNFKENCWLIKDTMQFEVRRASDLIVRKKALNPLISDELVNLSQESFTDLDYIDSVLPIDVNF
ncbi:MAG: hypothetical protein ACJAT2_001208 [Bacteriovoracaceae bacterium]|jgi:hypothetical protein